MSGRPKFSILEINGQELGVETEYIPESEDILYERDNELTVKDKITFPNNLLFPLMLSNDLTIPENNGILLHDFDISNQCIEVDGFLGVF